MGLSLPNFPAIGPLLAIASSASPYIPSGDSASYLHVLAHRDHEQHNAKFIAFACFIPVLVLLSGLFSGLTLGYMSLDETQLKVLSISGSPQQRRYAEKIRPIRKNGHLLLVTLLLGNMIVNETLPVISAPVLGGGVQSVVVSTVLIVIFAEIIPQSLCTRYGLYFGAKLAGFVRVLIVLLGVVAWPVSKLLEFALGPHHGIIYRRAELKELIAMHSNGAELGGDLKTDTVAIIGGALDLQEKVVRQAMTPIKDVFMLSINAQLDYETLRRVCLTGHSRIPVYEEVEIPVPKLVAKVNISEADLVPRNGSRLSLDGRQQQTQIAKKIIGILLVKQCLLLDPNDATPVRNIPLNKEGRSHMAIVSRFSVQRATSVKKAVKRGLTRRLRDRVLSGDSDSSSSDEDERQSSHSKKRGKLKRSSSENDDTLKDDYSADPDVEELPQVGKNRRGKTQIPDIEMGVIEGEHGSRKRGLALPKVGGWGHWEQSMPADAVLTKEGVDEFLQSVDPAIMPLGIITLEDVLEELIGEEIYDEFDPQGHPDLTSYVQAEVKVVPSLKRTPSAPQLVSPAPIVLGTAASRPFAPSIVKPLAMPALRNLNFKVPGFPRSRSTPPMAPDDMGVREKTQDLPPPHSVPEGFVAPLAGSATGNVFQTSAATSTSEKPVQMTFSGEPAGPLANSSVIAVPVDHAPVPVISPDVVRTRSGPPAAPGGVAVMPVAPPLFAPPSRSTSPVPSLGQAIRVERKRRAASASGNQYSVKGGWFKSSPLNGEERTGVIVAERVKRDMHADVGSAANATTTRNGEQQQVRHLSVGGLSEPAIGGLSDVRDPDEKDKAGPDEV